MPAALHDSDPTPSASPDATPPDAEFAELMRRIQGGSRQAAEELHRTYGPHIRKAVRRRLHQRLRSKFDSIDFVQDVWASFFTDLPQENAFDKPEDLIALLTTMARNKVAQEMRTRLMRKKYNVNRETPLETMPRGADRFPAIQQTPSEICMDREAWERHLAKQPLVHRRILLQLRDGKPPEIIARDLQVSVRTVTRVLRKIPGFPPAPAPPPSTQPT